MKGKTARRLVAEAMVRGRLARQYQAPPPVDVRRVVAKAAPAISAEIARSAGAVYAAAIASLERQVAKLAAAQQTAPLSFYGYMDPQSREFVPLPDDGDRELGKSEQLAAAAAALSDGDPLRSELGRVAAFRELRQTRPWTGDR